MSDEEEHKMSEDGEEYGNKKTKVVLRVDEEKIAEKVREQLLREQNVDKGVQHFETLKEMAVEQFHEYEDQINACSTPAEVMEILEVARNEKKPPEQKKPPHGKSTFLPPSDSSKFADSAELIDKLYETAFYDLKASNEEKAEARKKINELWRSFETGKSMSQIREGGVKEIMKPTSECPNCWRTIMPPLSKNNPTCPYCSYNVRDKHEGRKGTSLAPHVGTPNGEIPRF